MKKVGKILLVIIGITVYLNFGWMMGAYYADHGLPKAEQGITTLGKFMTGPGGWMSNEKGSRLWWCALSSIGWPIGVAFNIISWVFYGVYYAGWFIFAGGIVKTLGLV
jgi:hypothetical protein